MDIKVGPKCFIGVGYNSCIDINFSAKDLFAALAPEISQLNDITPKVHASISTLHDFVETFLHHFKEGVNGEYVSQSKELFFLLRDRLDEANIDLKQELGGHSSVWALTAQKNNCKVYAAPQPHPQIL
jgi:hypothetical protein